MTEEPDQDGEDWGLCRGRRWRATEIGDRRGGSGQAANQSRWGREDGAMGARPREDKIGREKKRFVFSGPLPRIGSSGAHHFSERTTFFLGQAGGGETATFLGQRKYLRWTL